MQREPRYAGMTTNERLFEAGLLSEWTAAARSRNRERMIELLSKVDLGDQAESITDTVRIQGNTIPSRGHPLQR